MAPRKNIFIFCLYIEQMCACAYKYGEKTSLKKKVMKGHSHIHALTASWGLRWYTALHHWYKPTSQERVSSFGPP